MEYEKQRKVIIILSIIIAMALVGLAKLSLLSAEPQMSASRLPPWRNHHERSDDVAATGVRNECEQMQLHGTDAANFNFLDEGSCRPAQSYRHVWRSSVSRTSSRPRDRADKPLIIYGRTDDPFTIKGLKVGTGKDFQRVEPPQDSRRGSIGDLQATGFDNACSWPPQQHIVACRPRQPSPIAENYGSL
jgi:hypothetical protein